MKAREQYGLYTTEYEYPFYTYKSAKIGALFIVGVVEKIRFLANFMYFCFFERFLSFLKKNIVSPIQTHNIGERFLKLYSENRARERKINSSSVDTKVAENVSRRQIDVLEQKMVELTFFA